MYIVTHILPVHKLKKMIRTGENAMTENNLHYFAGGHTAEGFYHLYETNIESINHLYVLTGQSLAVKSSILDSIYKSFPETKMECIHRAIAPDLLEGIIFPEVQLAIIDEASLPKQLDDEGKQTIDLCDSIRDETIIDTLRTDIGEELELAFQAYHKALNIHDDWERIYIKEMDFTKADQIIDDWIKAAFKNKQSQDQNPTRKRRFLGAATPEGPVDFVPNITEGLTHRYFLKGRAGSGKSTFLKRVVKQAEQLGYGMEIYHCGFDPGSLDMVVVRELGWAIFDSTKPHEYFPERDGDIVIDMYEKTITPGTDERYANEISIIESKYREQMNIAKKHLQISANLQTQVEKQYIIDEQYIEKLINELKSELTDYLY